MTRKRDWNFQKRLLSDIWNNFNRVVGSWVTPMRIGKGKENLYLLRYKNLKVLSTQIPHKDLTAQLEPYMY